MPTVALTRSGRWRIHRVHRFDSIDDYPHLEKRKIQHLSERRCLRDRDNGSFDDISFEKLSAQHRLMRPRRQGSSMTNLVGITGTAHYGDLDAQSTINKAMVGFHV